MLISQEMDDIMQFTTKMYCDISKVAQNPLWKKLEVKQPDGSISEEDQFTPALLEELKTAVQPLVTILNKAGCQRSMPKK